MVERHRDRGGRRKAAPPIGHEGHRVSGGQIGAAVLAIVLLGFVIANGSKVQVHLLVTKFSAPLFFVLAVVIVLSFLVGWLVGRSSRS